MGSAIHALHVIPIACPSTFASGQRAAGTVLLLTSGVHPYMRSFRRHFKLEIQ